MLHTIAWYQDRNKRIRELEANGWPMKKLAAEHGLTFQRISQIVNGYRHRPGKQPPTQHQVRKRHAYDKHHHVRVYFVRVGAFVKIGITNNLDRRMRSLEGQCPFPVELLAACAGGRPLEKALHARFAHRHHRLEWYHYAADLDAAIWELQRAEAQPGVLT